MDTPQCASLDEALWAFSFHGRDEIKHMTDWGFGDGRG